MEAVKEYFSVHQKEILVAAGKVGSDRGCRFERLSVDRSTHMPP